MSARLRAGACVLVLGSALLGGCGGSPQSQVAPAGAPVEQWPVRSEAPHDAITVRAALACADGAQVRVRAHLVAVTVPCPVCSVGERRGTPPDPRIGKSPPPKRPDMPGCLPCPSPAATFNDEGPTASATPSPPLRAVGAAEGLQPRHVGKEFLLTGIFRARGSFGPELEVTDVRALEER